MYKKIKKKQVKFKKKKRLKMLNKFSPNRHWNSQIKPVQIRTITSLKKSRKSNFKATKFNASVRKYNNERINNPV